MAVQFYRSTDVGAPVLTRTPGDLLNLLDKCLVTGYGSKAPLGWTKSPFSTPSVGIYRNDTSIPSATGMYLRVADTSTDVKLARVYKTMSSASAGTDVQPRSGRTSNSMQWMGWYHDSNNFEWALIGDGKTFYLNTSNNPANQYTNKIQGAGDYISYVPGNNWNYMVFGGEGTQTYMGSFPCFGTDDDSGARIFLGRNATLTPETQSRGSSIGTTVGTGSDYYYSGHSSSYPYSAAIDKTYFTTPHIAYRPSNIIAGELRGVKYFMNPCNTNWLYNFGPLPGSGDPMIQFATDHQDGSPRFGAGFAVQSSGTWNG